MQKWQKVLSWSLSGDPRYEAQLRLKSGERTFLYEWFMLADRYWTRERTARHENATAVSIKWLIQAIKYQKNPDDTVI